VREVVFESASLIPVRRLYSRTRRRSLPAVVEVGAVDLRFPEFSIILVPAPEKDASRDMWRPVTNLQREDFLSARDFSCIISPFLR